MASSASLPIPDPPLRVAQRYVVQSEIARGGMGVVYRVLDTSRDLVCALKRVKVAPQARGAAAYRSAFEREFQVLASLDHPAIIRVYDYGVDELGPYYTMELVGGRDLRELVPLPWRAVCHYLRDVAGALSLLHARRLLHRDLSPSNVKVTPDGRCKLLDFGALADFGYPRYVVGTPPMIAREALAGRMLDQRTDLYALGALAYWALTGRHAYPAPHLDDLEACWKRVPPPPSVFERSIPRILDALVMSMLSANPLARPTSAAEVIAHLDGVAELEPAHDAERQRLARSFLATPPFVGRDGQLEQLALMLRAVVAGKGGTLCVEGPPGGGRTRFLEEIGVRAQIAGAVVLRVDASMHPTSHGTSRALAQRLLEALPERAQAHAGPHAALLARLGIDLAQRSVPPPPPAHGGLAQPPDELELADWFLTLSEEKPLVVQVDNVAYADDVSLGLLLSLSRAARTRPLLLMVVDRSDVQSARAIGLRSLRDEGSTLTLTNLTAAETLAQVRSMFGDAPNVARYADWLHGLTTGSPLLSVEISRQLVERGTIRYDNGMWVLPTSRPQAVASALIEDVLASRIAGMSHAARALAQCLALQQVEATFALCVLVSEPSDERIVLSLLTELAEADIVQRDHGSYRFSSTALREVLLARMDVRAHEESHLRLGLAFARLSGGTDHVLRLQAGWHLIHGGRALEGAELIDTVVRDEIVMRRLNANMVRIGPAVEAALHVYKRHRRSTHERMALLAALGQAGLFEEPRWEDTYADDALDLLEDLSGMLLARRLRWLGRLPALIISLTVASIRFVMLPKNLRHRSFYSVLLRLFGNTICSVGIACFRLDGDRAARVARVLEPFSALPRHLTAPSIHRFCEAMQYIAREHQAKVFATFDEFSRQLDSPRYFRSVPQDARPLFVNAAHFARGAFAIFRADGRAALESIERLERSGLRMYEMVGSQLHFLYHANRGELAQAAKHRAQVELHAAHFGSAWQVELWEAAALLPLQLSLDDATEVARLAHRLEEAARSVPTLRLYAKLAQLAVLAVRNKGMTRNLMLAEQELSRSEPRSFIGWSTSLSILAKAYNSIGRYEDARAACERVLATMTEDDREYVSLFLHVDIEASHAEAGLGEVDHALARLDRLLARFDDSGHPLTLGLLHEARARIAFHVSRMSDYERSLVEVERWFGASETPALVAKCERLRELNRPPDTLRGRRSALAEAGLDAATSTILQTELMEDPLPKLPPR